MDQTLRAANLAVLVKLQTGEGTPAVPASTADAIPVESDSISIGQPWTNEQSNEASGSLVTGAPLIIGKAATVGFRSRVKGVGAGQVYSPAVKPPLHQTLQACGMRGQFHPAVAAQAASAGSATSATLGASYAAIARALIGIPLLIGAGAGSGRTPFVVDYDGGRVATVGETFAPALDATSSIATPAAWSYASTSPSDAAGRLADQPAATIYVYRDGVLYRFTDCRGTVNLNGQSARPGFAEFAFTGIYAGKVDAPIPTDLVVNNNAAPVLVQASDLSNAALLNRKPLPLQNWSVDNGSQVESPDDPNTPFGFGAGQIADRTPVLKVNPLATLVATRDTISDIGAGTTMTAVLRHGSQPGNRWALTMPLVQPTDTSDGTRGKLLSEEISLQCRSLGRDAYGRDTDRVLTFY